MTKKRNKHTQDADNKRRGWSREGAAFQRFKTQQINMFAGNLPQVLKLGFLVIGTLFDATSRNTLGMAKIYS